MRKTILTLLVTVAALTPVQAIAQLKLFRRMAFPGNVSGHFDHFAVDLRAQPAIRDAGSGQMPGGF